MGIEYQQGIVYGDGSTVFWWTGKANAVVQPCYLSPFPLTNVPAGIDGLEFV